MTYEEYIETFPNVTINEYVFSVKQVRYFESEPISNYELPLPRMFPSKTNRKGTFWIPLIKMTEPRATT
jgi:hypothetical protein